VGRLHVQLRASEWGRICQLPADHDAVRLGYSGGREGKKRSVHMREVVETKG